MPRFFCLMKELRITTIQTSLHWEAPSANKAMLDEKLRGLEGQTDLIVLPEMFTTGFSMQPGRLAEPPEGPTLEWMKIKARSTGAAIMGSYMVKQGGVFFNRLVFVQPGGQVQHYDKRHLFTLAGEHRFYQSGKRKVVVEWQGWTICPMICYDLRFPVWSRNVEGFDLLVYVANWPAARAAHWRQLLVARAIENQVYTVGVNRVGTDDNGLSYSGDTSIADFAGTVLYSASEVEAVFTCRLDRESMVAFREKWNFLADRDFFEISSR